MTNILRKGTIIKPKGKKNKMDFLKRAWAEVDLDSIEYNLKEYRRLIGEKTEIMCVVKASCYGHFDNGVVPFLENEMDIRWFAVSNIHEAHRLRDMGIKGEILILGYTPPENAKWLTRLDIIQACTELSYAKALSENADGKVRIHAAIDTGMTRIGLHGETDKIYGELKEISKLENISLEGIFTHYAVADSLREQDEKYTKAQTEKILAVADKCEAEGLHLEKVHFLNSAGGVYYYNKRSSLARLGIILYGLYPDPAKALPFEPKPAMEFKAAVAQVKYIDNGTDVSYGRTYTANGKVKLATVTAGYADGYPRALSNKGYVLINGKKCPITGRICMDQFMCDVTEVEDVKAGDEAVLIGAQGDERITADDIGKMTGTIGYEIVCGISARVPRVISRHGEQTAVLEIE